jgi:3-methyladenine DNA glycosylase AlkC
LFTRAEIVAGVLADLLPDNPEDKAATLVMASGAPREIGGYGPMANYRFLVLTRTVSLTLTAKHPHLALDALGELTQRFTAEFDIRYLLRNNYRTTLRRLHAWVGHTSLHVRRLVAEGSRPRLPWASHFERFKDDPKDLIPLLEALRSDPTPYVRLSVANCVGDILKDNREFALDLLEAWLADSQEPNLRWIIGRALRYPVRMGDQRAMEIASV